MRLSSHARHAARLACGSGPRRRLAAPTVGCARLRARWGDYLDHRWTGARRFTCSCRASKHPLCTVQASTRCTASTRQRQHRRACLTFSRASTSRSCGPVWLRLPYLLRCHGACPSTLALRPAPWPWLLRQPCFSARPWICCRLRPYFYAHSMPCSCGRFKPCSCGRRLAGSTITPSICDHFRPCSCDRLGAERRSSRPRCLR